MIDASLNEIEALTAKAARGAGLSWGLSEDTGKAARWLAACGSDWAPGLVALLGAHDQLRGPLDTNLHRQLSPLFAGTYSADLCISETALANVAYPLWLLPFAARVAADRRNAVRVSWDGLSVVVWPVGCAVAGSQSDLLAARAEHIVWAPVMPGAAPAGSAVDLPHCVRSAIRRADWRALEALGARTYVPASVQSRATGAGAGLTDND